MQFFANLFLLAHQLRTTIGLRVLDNGIGPPLYGAEGSIVNYALLDGDQKEILPSQVQAHSAFDIQKSFISSSQFTICSSATSTALLTTIHFFQLLRKSGSPWIGFTLQPQPGSGEHTFKLTVNLFISVIS